MARISVTIEDAEEGVVVSWAADNHYIDPHGTEAEKCAMYILEMLAAAGEAEIPTVKAAKEGPN